MARVDGTRGDAHTRLAIAPQGRQSGNLAGAQRPQKLTNYDASPEVLRVRYPPLYVYAQFVVNQTNQGNIMSNS